MSETTKETAKAVVYAIAVALIIRMFAFEPFNIPSGSMIPNLLIGDYLFVSKYSYGYSKYSFPFSPVDFKGRLFETEPKRGDIIVFRYPAQPNVDFIKRLIGLPGDKIQVKNGILHINGKPIEREKVKGEEEYIYREINGNVKRFAKYKETLPEGKSYNVIEVSDTAEFDNTEIFTVPENHYFMMGDNRDNSSDSRSKVGFVPKENLIGRAEFIFFSNDGTESMLKFWTIPKTTRFERFFDGIS
ncbi:MAG: signal peptidase I [Alphaproteobacteria bacterium]|nr:signal peptidase I [Alphaproteobacteria bacterium]